MVESVISTLNRYAARSAGIAQEGQTELVRLLRSRRALMTLPIIIADALAALTAFNIGDAIHGFLFPVTTGSLANNPSLLAIGLMLPFCHYLMDVYRVSGMAPIERFQLRIKSTSLFFFLLISWHYAASTGPQPMIAIVPTFVLVLILPLIGEAVIRNILIRLDVWGLPAVVIGADAIGQRVIRVLNKMPELGLRPVGLFEDGDKLPSHVQGVPVLGSITDSVAYNRQIETAIITNSASKTHGIDAIANDLGYRNLIIVPDLRELPTLWVRARDFNGLIGLQMRRNLLMRRNRWLKVVIDRLLALPLFVLSLPIILVLASLIRIKSEGSPFYTQLRIGKDNRPIKIWKLRTMYADAEQRLHSHLAANPDAKREWNRYFKLTDDPRILPGVGRFLRRTSLDELPQLFNVIRGEMSLVGPRPFPRYHVDKFDQPFQKLRSSVFPGLTGLWQVSARSDGDLKVQQALDTYYIRNWSVLIDLYILLQTFGAVIVGRGAR